MENWCEMCTEKSRPQMPAVGEYMLHGNRVSLCQICASNHIDDIQPVKGRPLFNIKQMEDVSMDAVHKYD